MVIVFVVELISSRSKLLLFWAAMNNNELADSYCENAVAFCDERIS